MLSSEQKVQYSAQICQHLILYLQNKGVQQLLVYKALPDEVNTDFLFKTTDIEVFAPKILADTKMNWLRVTQQTVWEEAGFGVFEPASGDIWQLNAVRTMLLCPLLGFDAHGNRLGMGKGYFDRWLAKHGENIDVVGLAFSCQELSKVPIEPHDVPLNTIITEHGVISCPTP